MLGKETSRLSRLTAILTMLQSKRMITATKLADRFDVSVRTIYRDMRALEQAGVPVATEDGKGYSLAEGYRVPPVMFTEGEAMALITAEVLIRGGKDQSLMQEFSSAVEKIRAVLSYSSKTKIEHLERRVFVGKSYTNEPASRFLLDIQKALTERLPLRIDYGNEEGTSSQRIIEPFALYNTMEDHWVVIAYCRLREDFRAFRLDRIARLQMLSDTFEPHKLTLEQFVKKNYGSYYNP